MKKSEVMVQVRSGIRHALQTTMEKQGNEFTPELDDFLKTGLGNALLDLIAHASAPNLNQLLATKGIVE